MNRILARLPRLAVAANCPRLTAPSIGFVARQHIALRTLSTSPPAGPPSSRDTAATGSSAPTESPATSSSTLQSSSSADPISATDAFATTTDAAGAASVANTSAESVAVITDSALNLSDWWLQPALALINTTHDMAGLPWYLAIAASTIAVRTMLLPATLFTMRNSARMQAIQPDIAERREAVLEAARAGNQQLAKKHQVEMQTFMRNAGVSPMKIFVGPLVQFPVFISFFVGIRRLSQADPSFVTGGAAWFNNLAVMDPTYILPVLCGASLFGMTELGGDSGAKMTPQMRTGMRVVAALSVPMTYWFPAAVFCYWIPNNMFSMLLALSLRTPTLRHALGLKADAAKIPGTKANKDLIRKMAAFGQKSGMAMEGDVGAAIASYARSDSATEKVIDVKPVLLKHRPARRNSNASGR